MFLSDSGLWYSLQLGSIETQKLLCDLWMVQSQALEMLGLP